MRRFLAFPFGYDPSGRGAIPDLGLRLAFREHADAALDEAVGRVGVLAAGAQLRAGASRR